MPVPLPADAITAVINIGNELVARVPRAWSKCHINDTDPERYDFIILFGRAASQSPVIRRTHLAGINGKRGDAADLSMDVLDFLANGVTDLHDVTAADVVSGAGGPSPFIQYQDITAPSPPGAGAIYVDPFSRPTHVPYDTPQPVRCKLGYSSFILPGLVKHDPGLANRVCRIYTQNGGGSCLRVIAHTPRSNADGSPGVFHTVGIEWSDPDFLDVLRRTDDLLWSYDLLWHLVFTAGIRGIESDAAQDLLVDRINDAFVGRPGRRLLDEMANEYEVNGLNTAILRRMCRRNHPSSTKGRWVALSSPNAAHNGGDLPDEVRRMHEGLPESNAITVHWDRAINRPPDLGPFAPPTVICGEPRGPKASAGGDVNDPRLIVGDMQAAEHASYVLYHGHSDSGFINNWAWPGPMHDGAGNPTHGHWPTYLDHARGGEILLALKTYHETGQVPDSGDSGGGNGGGGPVIPYDDAKSREFGFECNKLYLLPDAPPSDPGMISVHSQRAAWDYYVGGLTWPDSLHKHVNAFYAEYGFPPPF